MDQSELLFKNLLSSDKLERTQSEQLLEQVKQAPFEQSIEIFRSGANSTDVKISQMALITFKNTYLSTPGQIETLTPEQNVAIAEFAYSLVDLTKDTKYLNRVGDILGRIGGIVDLQRIFTSISGWISSDNDEVKSFGTYCLKELSESNSLTDDIKKSESSAFISIFESLLSHNKGEIRNLGLSAIVNFLTVTSETSIILIYSCLSQKIIESLVAALRENSSVSLASLISLNILTDCVPCFWNDNLDLFIEVLCQIVSESIFEKQVVDSAASILATLCKTLAASIKKNATFSKMYFAVIISMLADLDTKEDINLWNSRSDLDDNDREEKWYIARFNLNQVATFLGADFVVNTAGQMVSNLIASSNWIEVHVGLSFLAWIITPNNKFLKKNQDDLVAQFTKALNNAHPRVQWVALVGLENLFRDMGQDIKKKNVSNILNCVFSLLEKNLESIRLVVQCVSTLLEILRTLSHEKYDIDGSFEIIEPFSDGLVRQLASLLQNSIKNNNVEVQENTLSSFSCLAVILDKEFGKYYQEIMPFLFMILEMNPSNEAQKKLRANSISTIAALMGSLISFEELKDDFKKVADILMKILGEIKEQDPELNAILASFSAISTCLGEDFLPYLHVLFPILRNFASQIIEVKMEDYEESELKDDEKTGNLKYNVNIMGVGKKSLSVNTFACQSKQMALEILCEINEFNRHNFASYLEAFLEIIVSNISFPYSRKVRKNCFKVLWRTLTYLNEDAVKSQQIAQILMPHMIEQFDKAIESDYKFEDLRFMVKHIGKVAEHTKQGVVDQFVETIYEKLAKLLEKTEIIKTDIYSQIGKETDENVIAGLEDELNSYNDLNRRVMIANGAFIKLYKDNVEPIIQKHLLPWYNKSFERVRVNWDDTDETLYCLCFYIDLIEHGQALRLETASKFFEATKTCTDEDEAVLQTIVYGYGEIAHRLDVQTCNPILNILLEYVTKLIFRNNALDDDQADITDNAIGALGKIVYFQLKENRQLGKEFLARLPLNHDMEESKSVSKLFFEQIIGENSAILNTDLIAEVKAAMERTQALNLERRFLESEETELMVQAIMQLKSL